ncbi:MAG: nucleotide exchange factor GrpE [Candidatus Odinarchaeota archaeon]
MEDSNNNDLKEGVDQNVTSGNKSTEEQVDMKEVIETEDVKKLEEKEHYELDFFSKEDLVKEKEKLEKQLEELKKKTEKLNKENGESKNKLMHLQAEFENAQKRWDKNRQNLRIEYTASVLKNFLPLYDSFKKAIDSSNDKEKDVLTSFFNQFMNIFKSYGVEPIQVSVNDKFDYNFHEALTTVEKEDLPENSILEVVQDGFKYNKEVIRYAKVIITRKPKLPKPEPEEKRVKEKEVVEEISEGMESEEILNKQEENKEKKNNDKKHKKDKIDK